MVQFGKCRKVLRKKYWSRKNQFSASRCCPNCSKLLKKWAILSNSFAVRPTFAKYKSAQNSMNKSNQSAPAKRGVGRPKSKMQDRNFQLVLTQTGLTLSISGADIIAHFGGSPDQLMAEVAAFIQSKTAQTDGSTTH
jgi:hypothetical protein